MQHTLQGVGGRPPALQIERGNVLPALMPACTLHPAVPPVLEWPPAPAVLQPAVGPSKRAEPSLSQSTIFIFQAGVSVAGAGWSGRCAIFNRHKTKLKNLSGWWVQMT